MPDDLNWRVSHAVALLKMPAEVDAETECVESLRAKFRELGIAEEDGPVRIREVLDEWVSGNEPDGLLVAATDALLAAGLPRTNISARNYFEMHSKLRSGGADWGGLTHAGATRLLSRVALIRDLLDVERLSSTQIARLLQSIEASLDVPQQAIGVIARHFSLVPAHPGMEAGRVLWDADSALALELFPDSDVGESTAIVGRECSSYVPEFEVAKLLTSLIGVGDLGEIFWPYLEILHYCCVPLEYFDHPASYLYEFSPRGQVADQLFAHYPTATNNPFLNNAKAVQSLNASWAKNRGGDNAAALVALLAMLESIPFGPRKHVARLIRAWLCRVIELEAVRPTPLNVQISMPEVMSLLESLGTVDTGTQGVLEQRISDSLCILAFMKDGWRANGIGQSVNASNYSTRKLGDVEFVHVDNRESIAVEIHGGHLSAAYVRDHQRSLARGVELRLKESWSLLDEPDVWAIKVIFVSHSRDVSGLPDYETVAGVRVHYEYWEYAQLIDLALDNDESVVVETFARETVAVLNHPNVRQTARDKFARMLGM